MADKVDMPRYLDALMKAATPEGGGVVMVEVRHDDWCQHWKGKPCNCDPDITSKPVDLPE